MSDGLRAEDVKEALDEAEDAVTYQAEVLASEHPWPTVVAAARAYLASQEQTPDYYEAKRTHDALCRTRGRPHTLNVESIQAIVDAALAGFHPQPKGDER